jgi:hypothetical protein
VCNKVRVANNGYSQKPVKGYKMAQVKNTKVAKATTPAKVATLQNTGTAITNAQVWAFVNTHAAGNPHNVQVKALPNVQLNNAQPVPFGFTGKGTGVRATIQNWLLNGVNGNNSLAAILNAAKPLGHSTKNPVCLMAMLNGGYSPSSAVWGTGYVKLVVQPQPTA